jgi:hypothetical protein
MAGISVPLAQARTLSPVFSSPAAAKSPLILLSGCSFVVRRMPRSVSIRITRERVRRSSSTWVLTILLSGSMASKGFPGARVSTETCPWGVRISVPAGKQPPLYCGRQRLAKKVCGRSVCKL